MAEVNKCLPESQELEGYGDGCTYWHGKLVPGTRIGRVQWMESPSVIQAVLEATTERGRDGGAAVAQLKEKLVSSMGRTITRWFFNSRTLISEDKYELKSFEPGDLQLKDSRSIAQRAAATDANAVRGLLNNTDLLRALKDRPGNSQLIISDIPVRPSQPTEADTPHSPATRTCACAHT